MSEEFTFTPGPWQHAKATHLYESGNTQTFGADGVFAKDPLNNGELTGICQIFGIPSNCTIEELERDRAKGVTLWDAGLANAHLIAAAPELYDALKLLLEADVYADGEGLVSISHSDTESGERAVRVARAAIAKAEARSDS